MTEANDKKSLLAIFLEGVVLFSLKLFQKLVTKLNSQKTQLKLPAIAKEVAKLYEISLPTEKESVKELLERCRELLQLLRVEVRARDYSLKAKFIS